MFNFQTMRKLFPIFLLSFFAFLLAAPSTGLALSSPPIPYWGNPPLVSCTGIYMTGIAKTSVTQKSCTSLCDLLQTIVNITYFGITLALFVFTPILFAWGGIMYLISGASPGQHENAKKILTGTLVGLLIVLFAFVVIKMFVEFFSLSNFIQGFGSQFNCNVQ